MRDLQIAAVDELSGAHYAAHEVATYLRWMAAPAYADELLSNNLTMALTADDRPAGTAGWCLKEDGVDTVRIRKVFVVPALAGQGVGRQLLTEVERQAVAAGLRCALVRANANAVAFYRRLGYRAVADGTMPVGNGVDLAVTYMCKSLAE